MMMMRKLQFTSCFIISQWQLAFIVCICINFSVILCAPRPFSKSNNISHIFPVYAIAERANLLNSTTCRKDLHYFQNAVNHRILWSLKILDSSGNPTSGFLYGNNFWLGARSQCLDTMNKVPLQISEKVLSNNTLYRDPEKEFPPFLVNYFVAYFTHNSTLQYHSQLLPAFNENLITLGLCLPASCNITDISFILERIFRDRVLQIGTLYSMDFKLIEVTELQDNQWLSTGAILIICVLVLTFSLMIIGTIYDIFVHQKYFIGKNKNIGSVQNVEKEYEEIATSSLHRESTIGKILICFSVYTNTKIIFNTKVKSDTIPVIHGLKFWSMNWIIMFHSIVFSIDYIDNKPWILRLSDGFFPQIMINAILAVDTFFFLSGFLLAYWYLKRKMNTQKSNYKTKLKELLTYTLKRFIRLTPAYMITIGILQRTFFWYNNFLFYTYEKPQISCTKFWWSNILYINNYIDMNINYIDMNTMCMSWSWYLASDMQFYIIGIALLILSTVCLYWTIVILGVLLIGSILLSGYISYIYEYIPTLDELFRLINVMYFPSWVRIGPYIIGILTGFLVIRLNNTLILKKRTVTLYWCIAITCNILVLFGLYKRHISVLSSAIYVALSRTVWAIGIAWILVACLTENGGIVNRLLSFRGWIPLSKLTYCAYLIHPFIIHTVRLDSETSMHVELTPSIIMSLGYLNISYFFAYYLSLMAEMPYILLAKINLNKKKNKSREIQI